MTTTNETANQATARLLYVQDHLRAGEAICIHCGRIGPDYSTDAGWMWDITKRGGVERGHTTAGREG